MQKAHPRSTHAHRIILFDRDEGGSNPALLGWYEFIWKTNTWSGSYMNSHTQRGVDNPALGGVVESIPFLERRIKGRIKGHIKGRIKGRIKGHIKARRNLPRLPNLAMLLPRRNSFIITSLPLFTLAAAPAPLADDERRNVAWNNEVRAFSGARADLDMQLPTIRRSSLRPRAGRARMTMSCARGYPLPLGRCARMALRKRYMQ